MIAVKTPLFKPGQVVATPAALEALEQAGQNVWVFLTRHLAGDWGMIDAHDKAANDEALKDGSRLLSAYRLKTKDSRQNNLPDISCRVLKNKHIAPHVYGK